jgi:predicted site-specific integrase-resolvase
MRFGFEMIEQICHDTDTELIVIDKTETPKSHEEELAEDLISIIHHFSMKLYGSRSYKKKLKEKLDENV